MMAARTEADKKLRDLLDRTFPRRFWVGALAVFPILLVALYTRFPERTPPYLWLDEAWRAYVIISSDSLGATIDYLTEHHRAPLFIPEWALGKVGLHLFGRTELAFRCWPLLFAVLGVLGAYAFLCRVSTRAAAVFAALSISVGGGFICHAREFKPYALDLALTTWMLHAADRLRRESERSTYALFLAVSLAFAVSTPVFVFVFPAATIYALRSPRGRGIPDLLVVIIPVVVFLANYLAWLRPQATPGLQMFWSGHYLSSIDSIGPVIRNGLRFVDRYFSPGWVAAAVAYLVLLPAISLRRRDGVWALLLIPFLLQAAASIVERYPLFDRPSHYLYGLMVIAVAYVLGSCAGEFDGGKRGWRHAAATLGTLGAAAYVGWTAVSTGSVATAMKCPRDGGREALRVLDAKFQEGDVLEISKGAYFTFLFYKDGTHLSNPALLALNPWRERILNDESEESVCRTFRTHGDEVKVGDRVWFLTSKTVEGYLKYSILSEIGRIKTFVRARTQGLILLEVQRPLSDLAC